MCRNGTEFGIRVSGLGDEWFTAPSPFVEGLYVPGFSEKDAGFDMGDSAITETVDGVDLFWEEQPGSSAWWAAHPKKRLDILVRCGPSQLASHPTYKMPIFGFEGTPTGIDIRKVVQTNSAPIIDTAIAHKDPGYPKIGAGLVRAPMECFKKALIAFSRKYQS